MHLRSAYLYKWDVGPYTHWLLQRDRGGTGWGGGGHRRRAGGGDRFWKAKQGQLASLGSDVQPAGVWFCYKYWSCNWLGIEDESESVVSLQAVFWQVVFWQVSWQYVLFLLTYKWSLLDCTFYSLLMRWLLAFARTYKVEWMHLRSDPGKFPTSVAYWVHNLC